MANHTAMAFLLFMARTSLMLRSRESESGVETGTQLGSRNGDAASFCRPTFEKRTSGGAQRSGFAGPVAVSTGPAGGAQTLLP